MDQKAFRYLLETHCAVYLGKEGEEVFEEEIPIRFYLTIRDTKYRKEQMEELTQDLVMFFSSDQRDYPSPEFDDALEMIAKLAPSGRRRVDIEVPVRVWFVDLEADAVDGRSGRAS